MHFWICKDQGMILWFPVITNRSIGGRADNTTGSVDHHEAEVEAFREFEVLFDEEKGDVLGGLGELGKSPWAEGDDEDGDSDDSDVEEDD